MKKLAAILVVLIATFTVAPQLAAAAQEDYAIENPINATSIAGLIDGLAHFLFLVGISIAPVMILVGAFYYLTAGADPDRVSKANKIIIYTLVGVAILYMSDILMDMIKNILGVSN
ncbi:MAG: hypothetical protein V5A57_00610 [Candidatus Paceibacterota bacterium]